MTSGHHDQTEKRPHSPLRDIVEVRHGFLDLLAMFNGD